VIKLLHNMTGTWGSLAEGTIIDTTCVTESRLVKFGMAEYTTLEKNYGEPSMATDNGDAAMGTDGDSELADSRQYNGTDSKGSGNTDGASEEV